MSENISPRYADRYSRGQKLELAFSKVNDHDPSKVTLLVSPVLLRKRNLGQVDCAWFSKTSLCVGECKSGSSRLNKYQYERLVASVHFLASLFQCSGKLFKIEEEFAKSDKTAYPFKIKKIMELA